MEKFDVVIIGAGPAGLGLAYGLKQAGQTVAVVEENRWGGTCPNRGCDPKKVLMAAVEAKLRSRHLVGKGLENEPEIDWPSLMRFKETFTEPVSSSSRQGLVDAGITVLDGHAEFVDQHTLKVGEQRVESSQFVIATGQRPGRLRKIENEALMQTSTDFLAMPELPKRIALVGGGYIAFELAAIANAAGAEVHVIHHNDRPLKQFPAESVKQFMEQLTKQGVQFHLNIDVTAIEKSAEGMTLRDDQQFSLPVDRVFVTAGRVPNLDTLNLEQAGIEAAKNGIMVDDHLKTTASNIYAMGDVVAKAQPKLTPVAGFEAQYLAQLLTHQSSAAIAYPVIPTVVYGVPQLAKAGVEVATAQKDSQRYEVKDLDLTNWFTYRRIQDPDARATVVVDRQSQQVVGVVTMSSEAEHVINDLTWLINHGGSLSELQRQIFAYPTEASDLEYLR